MSKMIVKIKDIQPAFNKAHRPMWEKHSGGRILSSREADTLPAEWWQREYNVRIISKYKSNNLNFWESAEFESEAALTAFLLRWS